MTHPIRFTPHVAFVGVEPSAPLREYAENKVGAVLGEDVTACRVALEAHGAHFRAKVEVDLPHAKIVVGSSREPVVDLYAAIDASAEEAKVALHEHARRARSQRKAV